MPVSKQLTQILPDITLYTTCVVTTMAQPVSHQQQTDQPRREPGMEPEHCWGPFHSTAGQGCRTASHPRLQRALPHLILKRNPFLFPEVIILVLPNSNPDIHKSS